MKRKIWKEGSFTIALFFSVSSNMPLAMAEKDSWPGRKKKKKLGRGQGKLLNSVFEKTHDLSEKEGVCSFKSLVLLWPLSNIFHFTSPEKK